MGPEFKHNAVCKSFLVCFPRPICLSLVVKIRLSKNELERNKSLPTKETPKSECKCCSCDDGRTKARGNLYQLYGLTNQGNLSNSGKKTKNTTQKPCFGRFSRHWSMELSGSHALEQRLHQLIVYVILHTWVCPAAFLFLPETLPTLLNTYM